MRKVVLVVVLTVVRMFDKFALLLSNPSSVSPVVCVMGRFVDDILTELVDVRAFSVLSSLLVMLICSLESFWLLLRFPLAGT